MFLGTQRHDGTEHDARDDDPFLERIADFRREDVVPLNEAFGFERFGRLINETRKTMEFFGWLAHLLVNGTVDHCNYGKASKQNCTLVFNDDVSGTLQQDVLTLFKEIDAFHPSLDSENFERIFSDKAKIDSDAQEMIKKPGALSDLLRLSTRFYSAWNSWSTSFANKTLNDRPYFQRQISALCYGDWKVRSPGDATTNVILALTYLMGPRCDRADHAAGEYDYIETTVYRDEYYNVADRKGFSGGDSNRCLQKFLIRFTDYDKKIYELFVDYMARYVFQTISFYGLCLPIAFPDQSKRESWMNWAVESVEAVHVQFVDALNVFEETPSDRPFMVTIDTFRRKQMIPINGSYGLERLRNVVDRTKDVMLFFGWLGSLFTNGVLGRYDENEEMTVTGAIGSESFRKYVLALFDEMYAFNKNENNNPNSDDPLDFFGAGRWYYSGIYKEVAVNFNTTPSSNGSLRDISYFCENAVDSRKKDPFPFNGIKAQLYLLQPGCEVTGSWQRAHGSWKSYILTVQAACMQLANESGLRGGDSNRCFQKFLARYVDYNRTVYEMFVDYVGQYLFQEVAVYGYCLTITRLDTEAREEWMTWAENSLKSIMKDWLNGLEIFSEAPTTTVRSVSSDETSWTISPTSPTNEMYDSSSTPVNEGSITRDDLKHVVDAVLPSEGVQGSLEWAKRADKHKIIAHTIYQNLTAAHNSRHGKAGAMSNVSFQVLISLLQDREQSDMQCVQMKNDRHIRSVNRHGVSYFIQYFNTSDLSVCLNATWNGVNLNAGKIVDAVFSSRTQNLCKSAKEEIAKAVRKEVLGVKDGFSGLAVVRCGRRFVWYQLSYRYFIVARSAGPSFALESANHDPYNPNCGQIFFFP